MNQPTTLHPVRLPFRFVTLPDPIAEDKTLTSSAKILFSVILTSFRRGRCIMGNQTLARKCGLSVTQVKRILPELEGRGLIARELRGRTRLQIRITWPGLRPKDDLRSLPYDEYLKTEHWQKIRLKTLERDRACAVCRSTLNLDVHHRTYERLGDENSEDLITLCRPCHELFHANGRLAKP